MRLCIAYYLTTQEETIGNPYLWNIACDYAVNNIISKAEIELPAYSLVNSCL